KAIMTVIEKYIFTKISSKTYAAKRSKSLFFLDILLNKDVDGVLSTLGTTPLKIILKSLVGMGNCLLSCSQKIENKNQQEASLHRFYDILHKASVSYVQNEECNSVKQDITIDFGKKEELPLSSFMKSQLYYWGAALLYEMIGEYKAAHSVYCQMLDAIQTCLPSTGFKASEGMLSFCHFIAVKSIQDSYKHYGHINTTEIDSFKRMLNLNLITDISLDDLSNSPDIEIVLYKYYHICFL
ncbi:MAG TPA: hypothetical protein DCW90_05695, partial [Lachnospiraceae bacterium]|nr:hypothetical protein [Lachnospiraceae bacterium]